MQIQRTPHGFDWSCAKIECLASGEKKGWVYLGVTTPRDPIEIYITKLLFCHFKISSIRVLPSVSP